MHSAILLTFIKLPFAIKIFVLSIFEWPFYTGFTCIISATTDILTGRKTLCRLCKGDRSKNRKIKRKTPYRKGNVHVDIVDETASSKKDTTKNYQEIPTRPVTPGSKIVGNYSETCTTIDLVPGHNSPEDYPQRPLYSKMRHQRRVVKPTVIPANMFLRLYFHPYQREHSNYEMNRPFAMVNAYTERNEHVRTVESSSRTYVTDTNDAFMADKTRVYSELGLLQTESSLVLNRGSKQKNGQLLHVESSPALCRGSIQTHSQLQQMESNPLVDRGSIQTNRQLLQMESSPVLGRASIQTNRQSLHMESCPVDDRGSMHEKTRLIYSGSNPMLNNCRMQINPRILRTESGQMINKVFIQSNPRTLLTESSPMLDRTSMQSHRKILHKDNIQQAKRARVDGAQINASLNHSEMNLNQTQSEVMVGSSLQETRSLESEETSATDRLQNTFDFICNVVKQLYI